MKLKPLLSLILFAAFFVANAQQNNIPSQQQLYLDFNGNTFDNSLNGLPTAVTNVNFEVDRTNSPLRAGRFGGCNSLSHVQVSGYNDQIDFTTGGTIAMWAKPDLNNSMDPATGNCIASGRHTFFSKGGDGFNTPPGFFAYTSINNGVQAIGFGASANSGNFEDTFIMPYTDTWHHYAFIFTTTNLKVYVDGVLKRNVAINLNYTEANNQTLYIGTLGPKSTPVNGITYWFPFGGLMDEFRLFTKELTLAEVTDVYNESYDMIAPSIQRKIFIDGRSGYYSGVSGSLFEYQNNTIVLSNRNTRNSFFTSDGSEATKLISYDSNGQKVWENEINNQLNDNAYNTLDASIYVLGDSSQTLIELSRVQGRGGRFLIIDNSTGTTEADVSLGAEKVIGAFKYNQEYVLILDKSSYPSYGPKDYIVKRFDDSGNLISSLYLDDSDIMDFDWSQTNGLLLTGASKTYIVNLPSLSYSQLSTSGKMCKWVGNNFIVSDDNHTYRISQSFSYNLLSNSFRNVSILNNGEYIVHNSNDIKRYNSNHILQATITSINYDVKLLPYSNNLYLNDGDYNKVYDLAGNYLWQIKNISDYTQNLLEQEDLSFLFIDTNIGVLVTNIQKLSSQGLVLWRRKFYNNSSIKALKSGSNTKLLVTSAIYSGVGAATNRSLFLLDIANESNPCNYNIDIGNQACVASFGNDNIRLYLGGILWERTEGSPEGTSLSFENISSGTAGFNQSGTYRFTFRQGTCKQIVERYVTVSDAFNPPAPIITASNNPICDGDTTVLTATGVSGTLYWDTVNFIDRVGNTAQVYPTTSTDYTAYYYSNTPQYGYCRSAISSPFTVNVITLPEVISLAGNSPLNATYRAERINSQQNVIINGAIDYKSKNAIVLNPGFSTNNNAVFNAKIVSSCTE